MVKFGQFVIENEPRHPFGTRFWDVYRPEKTNGERRAFAVKSK
jgi:hypothetical protein